MLFGLFGDRQSGESRRDIPAWLYNSLQGDLNNQRQGIAQFGQQAQQTAGRLGTNFGAAPSLANNFMQFGQPLQSPLQLGGQLDARGMQELSALQEQNAQATRQAQAKNAQALDPRVAAVANRQVSAQGALQGNAALGQALQGQDARRMQEFQANTSRAQTLTGLQQAGNQTLMQQTEMGANLLGLANQSQLQQLQARGLPLQAMQGMLGAGTSFGQLFSPVKTQSASGLFNLI